MAFTNHPLVLSLTHQLCPKTALSLIKNSSLISLLIYLTVATTGYLHYGENVQDNILKNEMGSVNIPVHVGATARVLLAIGLSGVYPILLDLVREGLFSYILDKKSKTSLDDSGCTDKTLNGESRHEVDDNMASNAPERTKTQFFLVTIFIFFITLIIALTVPGLDYILSLFGCALGSIVCYIVPAFLFAATFSKDSLWVKKLPFYSFSFQETSETEGLLDETNATNSHLDSIPVEIEIDVATLYIPKKIDWLMVYVNVSFGLICLFIGTSYAGYEIVNADIEKFYP